jgi:YVTN family beta-propeller protein
MSHRLAVLSSLVLLVACAEHGHDAAPSSIPLDGIGRQAVYVVNGSDATISVIDPLTDAHVGEIVLEGVEYPHHVHLDPTGERLLVAVPGVDLSGGHGGDDGGHAGHDGGSSGAPVHGMVLALDASSGELLAHRELDASNHNAIPSPDGQEVWTSQFGTPGAVVVLGAEDLEERNRIEVGNDPAEVTFSARGTHAFVCNTGSGTVSIIDTGTKEIVVELTVGTTPVGAWPGRDGNLYVDNEGSQTLSVIDGDTLEIVRTLELGFAPAMVAIAPTGALWVSDPGGSRVVVYDTATAEDGPVSTIMTGVGAHAIAFGPDESKAYISNQDDDTVSVVEVASGTMVETVPVGSKPNGMAVRRM